LRLRSARIPLIFQQHSFNITKLIRVNYIPLVFSSKDFPIEPGLSARVCPQSLLAIQCSLEARFEVTADRMTRIIEAACLLI
jgi:hypothetical protein